MSRRRSRPAAHALCPPTTPVRCGCALAAPAHAARSWSTNEADLSGARLPSSGSASRLPRRFTGLSITMASPVSSDPLEALGEFEELLRKGEDAVMEAAADEVVGF